MKIKNMIILSLLFFGVKGYSQTIESKDSLHTYKQSKINLELLGLSFQRESPLSKRNTYIINGGLNFDFYLSGGGLAGNERYGYAISPLLSVGSRHYYRLLPSSTKYRRNFGNFIGLDVGVRAYPIIKKNLPESTVIFALPYWGIQRKISHFGSFELGLGIAVKHVPATSVPNNLSASPNIQLRFGVYL